MGSAAPNSTGRKASFPRRRREGTMTKLLEIERMTVLGANWPHIRSLKRCGNPAKVWCRWVLPVSAMEE